MLTALVVVSVIGASPADASASRRIYVGAYLHDITEFDLKNGVFDVDLELWAKWLGSGFDPESLAIANGADLVRTSEGVESDGDWHSARWRVHGTMRGRFPLPRFPFDRHQLRIVLELPATEGELVADMAGSSMAPTFGVTEWVYEPEFFLSSFQEVFSSDLGRLEKEGQSTTMNRVAFAVVMERPIVTAILKLFLPLLIICTVALAALFMPPNRTEARTGMGITALLSCFAFQFSVSDSLPAVAYLTVADTVFLIAYLLAATSIVASIVALHLLQTGREGMAIRIDRLSRWGLPLLTVAGLFFAVPRQEPLPEEIVRPVPEMERAASARDVVRIGSTMGGSLTGSTVGAAAYYPVLYDDPNEGPLPVYVEQAPGVDNSALKFLAGGRLQVCWRLRPGVRWNDGVPLTSRDFAFALEASPNTDIATVETPDERTVVLTWKDRLAAAIESPWKFPEHALRTALDEGGYDALTKAWRYQPTATLGPYQIASHDEKGTVVGEPNPHFPGAAPSIRRVEQHYYDDREQLVRDFLAGDIDITVPNAITLEQALEVAEQRPEVVHIRPSAFLVFLDPDLGAPLVAEREVRRAILESIDRAALARDVYGDAGRPAFWPLPGEVPAGVEWTGFDRAAAKRRIVAAGAQGATIELLHGTSPIDTRIATFVAESMRAVGLTPRSKVVASTFTTKREGHHGGLLLHVVRSTRELSTRYLFNVPREKGRYDESARHDAYDDEIALLVEREERALYPERRRQLQNSLYAAVDDRLPILPLVFAAERVLAVPELQGWEVPPEVRFGRGMERWYFASTAGQASTR